MNTRVYDLTMNYTRSISTTSSTLQQYLYQHFKIVFTGTMIPSYLLMRSKLLTVLSTHSF